MWRKIVWTGILGLIALSFGCTMCCHPYDNNGPVYDSNGQCLSNVRAGSVLEGGSAIDSPVEARKVKIKATAQNAAIND